MLKLLGNFILSVWKRAAMPLSLLLFVFYVNLCYTIAKYFVRKKGKGCVVMARKIYVSRKMATRIWCTLVVLACIPSILLGIYYGFFLIPKQAFSAEQQKVVDELVADTAEYGEALGKITVNFENFTGAVIIQNGGYSLPQTTILSRIINSLLGSLVFCIFSIFALIVLYCFSRLFCQYEE